MGWSTFEQANPAVIHWGPGARAALAAWRDRPVALVTTRSLQDGAARLGLDPVATILVKQHAPETDIERGVHALRDLRPEVLVSLGGGSPIDAAKIIALRLGGEPPPHVAVPTTLSGAELAAGAGMTDASGNKVGLRDPRGRVSAVVYDAEIALGTPLELWLSTGVRALDHAVEGFLSPDEHPYQDILCLEGARRLLSGLRAAHAAPGDVGVRAQNQLAGWLAYPLPAAAAGLSHVMGKQVGARHGIPHGVTSCILLPHVLRYRAGREPRRSEALAAALGEDPAAAVERLVSELGLPQHLAAFGLGDLDLRAAAAGVAGTYPEADVLAVYRAAL